MLYTNYFVKRGKAEENQEKIFEVIKKYGSFKRGRLENEFLSKKSGLSLAQVRYALKKLEENKFVKLTYVSPKKDNLQRKITLLKSKFSHPSNTLAASPDKEKMTLKTDIYTKPKDYNNKKNFHFDINSFIENLEFDYQKKWIQFKLSINHKFDNFPNANCEIERISFLAKSFGISEELLVEVAIENNLWGLSMINTTHITAYQAKQNNVTKVNFTPKEKEKSEPVSKKEKELLEERSKKSIKTYLEQLKEENPKKWYKYSTQIEKLGLWLVEKKGFHFDCANHFAKTAEKLIKIVEDNNQDIEQVVNYNIKYNRYCYFIYAIGDGKKSKNNVISAENKFTEIKNTENTSIETTTQTPTDTAPKPKEINFRKENETEVIAQFREKIFQQFGANVYLAYFDDCKFSLENKTITISSENTFTIETIEKEFYSLHRDGVVIHTGVEDVLKKVNPELTLRYVKPNDWCKMYNKPIFS